MWVWDVHGQCGRGQGRRDPVQVEWDAHPMHCVDARNAHLAELILNSHHPSPRWLWGDVKG